MLVAAGNAIELVAARDKDRRCAKSRVLYGVCKGEAATQNP